VTTTSAPDTTASAPRTSSTSRTQPSHTATHVQQAGAAPRPTTAAAPAARTSTAPSPSASQQAGLVTGAAATPEQAGPVTGTAATPEQAAPVSTPPAPSRTLHVWPQASHVVFPGSASTVPSTRQAGTDSAPSPQALSTATTDSFHRPALAHRVPPVAPQPHPVDAPVPVPAASTAGGSASGLGGLFFFGMAALLASAGLARVRVISLLRRTADAAAPQPYLGLLEQPG
jgi:hypothetical protein